MEYHLSKVHVANAFFFFTNLQKISDGEEKDRLFNK
jgi:hypothetical protein